jgi:hypothetical protein
VTQILPPPNEREPSPLDKWDEDERAGFLSDRGWIADDDGKWRHDHIKGLFFVIEAACDIEKKEQISRRRKR